MIDENKVVDKLLKSNILCEEENSRKISLHGRFVSRRGEIHSQELAENNSVPKNYEKEIPFDLSVSDLGTDVVAVIVTLSEITNNLSSAELLTSALVVQQIEYDDPTTHVPKGFMPLNPEYLPIFQRVYPANVLFCWREDCPPCETVSSDFKDLWESNLTPDGIGLGAVYGPSCARELQEKFEVAVAPTTLFCISNRVDSRIIGSFGEKALQAEMSTIHNDVFQ